MRPWLVILCVIAYLAVGYAVAIYMGGDRSKLSPDVTFLDWLGILVWMLFWPIFGTLTLIEWVVHLLSWGRRT